MVKRIPIAILLLLVSNIVCQDFLKTALPKELQFLEGEGDDSDDDDDDDNGVYYDLSDMESTERMTGSDAQQLVKGFFEGVKLFEKIQHGGACKDADFAGVAAAMKQFAIAILKLRFNTTFSTQITALGGQVTTMVVELTKIGGNCGSFAREVAKVLGRVQGHTSSMIYLGSLPYHVITEYLEIKEKFFEAKTAYDDSKYFEAGKGFGGFIHHALLWDFS
jgi:hypothetical protein